MAISGVGSVKFALNGILVDAKKDIRAKMFQAFSNIVIASPVDEGRYRGNWKISVGSPDESQTDLGNVKNTNQGVIDDINSKLPETIGDGVFYFQNNVPYATKIEYEYEEPKGKVREEIQRLRRAINSG